MFTLPPAAQVILLLLALYVLFAYVLHLLPTIADLLSKPAAVPVVAAPAPAPAPVSCPYDGTIYTHAPTGARFCFYSKSDSVKGDMGKQLDFDIAVSSCQAEPKCLGFTARTNGNYLKSTILPKAKWGRNTGWGSSEGLYTKVSSIGSY